MTHLKIALTPMPGSGLCFETILRKKKTTLKYDSDLDCASIETDSSIVEP